MILSIKDFKRRALEEELPLTCAGEWLACDRDGKPRKNEYVFPVSGDFLTLVQLWNPGRLGAGEQRDQMESEKRGLRSRIDLAVAGIPTTVRYLLFRQTEAPGESGG